MSGDMRAILIKGGKGGIENLFLGNAPKPIAGRGDVVVQVKAFGINRGDTLQREGRYPPPPGITDIMGLEFAGVIAEVGPDVSGWNIGDEVMGLVGGGAYAEFVLVPHTHIMPKPSHLSWPEAASIPEAWLTAFQALIYISQFSEGETALVHAGASAVGVAVIQLARFYKAGACVATTSTQEKIDWLLSLPGGPTHAVNYKTQDFSAEVKKVTDGKGVNVVIDFVGRNHWFKNIDSLAIDGRMMLLGALSGSELENASLAPILYKRLRIQGSTLRTRPRPYQADLIRRFREEIVDHITGVEGSGKLKTYIYKVYPWTEIQQAHTAMEQNVNSGKIVVEIV